MRKRILELLRNNGGEPVSGEEISRQLEVSRTAIWKHIQTLKNEGYDIESVPKKGYILKEAPNRLFPQEILSRHFILLSAPERKTGFLHLNRDARNHCLFTIILRKMRLQLPAIKLHLQKKNLMP